MPQGMSSGRKYLRYLMGGSRVWEGAVADPGFAQGGGGQNGKWPKGPLNLERAHWKFNEFSIFMLKMVLREPSEDLLEAKRVPFRGPMEGPWPHGPSLCIRHWGGVLVVASYP